MGQIGQLESKLKELEAGIAERLHSAEAQNAALKRSLNQRPIVCAKQRRKINVASQCIEP